MIFSAKLWPDLYSFVVFRILFWYKSARLKASTKKYVMDTYFFVFSFDQLSFLHSLFVFCFFQARIRSRNEFGMSAETILDHFSTFDIQGKDIYPKYYLTCFMLWRKNWGSCTVKWKITHIIMF